MASFRNAGKDPADVLQNKFTAYLLTAVQRKKTEYVNRKNNQAHLRILEECIDQTQFGITAHEAEYGGYKTYIQSFLQFAADNPQYVFYHYPMNGARFRGRHYSAVDFLNIFSAFESECHAKPELYENADTSRIQKVKDSLVALIEEYPSSGLTDM